MPALAAFVGVIVTGRAWVYLIGLVPTLAGLARAAPTAGNIAREQERVALAGCPHSLLDGLTGRPPGGATG